MTQGVSGILSYFKKGALVWASASTLSLSGCITPPAPHDFQNSQTYAEPFDLVWRKTVQFFSSNNIEIKTIDKSSGVIYAEFGNVPVDNTFMDCGQHGLEIVVADAGQFNVFIVSNGGNSTTATINDDFQQTRTTISNTNQTFIVKCSSTGVLEQQILSSLGN